MHGTLTAHKTVEPGELTAFERSVAGGSAAPATDQERTWLDTFFSPLTTVAEVKRLLRGRFAPTVLIGFEFSGALRSAFEFCGYRALSCDLRECELGGMHARLDVFLVAHERVWDIVVLHPPCQNILRKDAACLSAKMNDGRAFWACMVVLHCICIASHASIVEQPDTVYSDFGLEPYVQLCASTFNDEPKKSLRLYMRNLALQPAPSFAPSLTKRLQSRPDHFSYQNPDTRDRARSSWAPFTNLCKAVAALLPTRLGPSAPPAPVFSVEVERFATAWHARGFSVPAGYHTGFPSSKSAQDYQFVRGAGDGRVVDAVTPCSTCHGGSGGLLPNFCTVCDPDLILETVGGSSPPAPLPPCSADGVNAPPPEQTPEPTQAWFGAVPLPVLSKSSASAAATLLVVVSVLIQSQPLFFAHKRLLGDRRRARPARHPLPLPRRRPVLGAGDMRRRPSRVPHRRVP